jgi:hypothetical protein
LPWLEKENHFFRRRWPIAAQQNISTKFAETKRKKKEINILAITNSSLITQRVRDDELEKHTERQKIDSFVGNFLPTTMTGTLFHKNKNIYGKNSFREF